MSTEATLQKSFANQQPDENICKFSAINEVNIVSDNSVTRFVYETSPELLGEKIMYPAFACHLVTGGTAVLAVEGKEYVLEAGDVFFAFPMIPFSLKEAEKLKYMYINFVGGGMEEMLASLEIGRGAHVCRKMGELIDIWFFALSRCSAENISMLGTGLLYYSLALVQGSTPRAVDRPEESIALKMKRSVDMCYQNVDLSIDYLAKQYKYNSKYLSRKFSTTFGVNFSDYLESCRMSRACVMLENTDKSVQEIAAAVGYFDPLYFSKVFKKHMKKSPTEYRKSIKK